MEEGKNGEKGEIFGDFSTFMAQLKGREFSEMRDFFTFFLSEAVLSKIRFVDRMRQSVAGRKGISC